jgi:FkbM family methyltransferase
MTVIEVGANFGGDTARLIDLFPSAQIFTFEPVRELVERDLWTKFGNNPRVHIIPFAVDIENTFKELNVTGLGDWGSSSLFKFVDNVNELWHNAHTGLKVTHSYKVPTITLYDFCNLYNIVSIDYLWIDAQGNDLNCLKSLKDKITIVKEGRCEADYSVQEYKDTDNNWGVVRDWLINNGFQVTINVDQNWPQQTNIDFKRVN